MSVQSFQKAHIRVIGRLDIKSDRLIKGAHLEGLRVVGKPGIYASHYYTENCDELLYIDVVASLYGRPIKADLISEAIENVFIPVSAGGGVRDLNDAEILFASGADKVVVNTAAVSSPGLLTDLAFRYGSQATVCSIEAKQVGEESWEIFTESGREYTGLQASDWARKAEDLGAGELLITSIDTEGTGSGFDVGLLQSIVDVVSVPVIASGGFGRLEHLDPLLKVGVNAVAIADAFHFKKVSVYDVKNYIAQLGYPVRMPND